MGDDNVGRCTHCRQPVHLERHIRFEILDYADTNKSKVMFFCNMACFNFWCGEI